MGGLFMRASPAMAPIAAAASNLVAGRAPTKLTHRELGRDHRGGAQTSPAGHTQRRVAGSLHKLWFGKNSTISELNHLSKPVGTRLPINLRGECHGVLTEQPCSVFALVKRDVMAEVPLAAVNLRIAIF